MAVTINTGGTYSVTRINNADSITNWTAVKLEGSGGGPTAEASVGTIDLVAEGNNAVASIANKQRVLLWYTAGSYDFTAGGAGGGTTKVPEGIVYMWAAFLAAGSALTQALGGMQLALGDGTNTSYWNIAGSDTYSGGFVKWAALTTVSPSETSGTAATLGNITNIGFVADVGTATTRFDNMVVDAMEAGLGLTFQGTTVSDTMFLESQVQDTATAIGVLSEENGIIFSQGSVEFSGTSMTSIGETMVFTDTLLGAYTYQFDVTGTVVMTNSIVNGSGNVDFNFDTSGATAFTMTGGSLGGFNTLTTASAQTMSGIVFQGGGASTVANTISDSSFNLCGLITVTGSLTGCTINKSVAAISTTTTDITKTNGNTFISDGSNHAVELTSVGTGEITFDDIATNYVAGTTGTNVTTGSTGNEILYLNFTSAATFVINVAAGSTVPSVRKGTGMTGNVNIVAGLTVLTIVTQNGNEVRIRQGSFTLQHNQTVVGGAETYSYTYVANTKVTVSVGASGFERQTIEIILPATDSSLLMTLVPSASYI